MKYLCIFILILPFMSQAFDINELCDSNFEININKIKGVDVIVNKVNCGPIVAKVSNIPFDINLSLSKLGNYAEVNFYSIDFLKNKSDLITVCKIFPDLVDIMANGNEYICTVLRKIKKEP